MADYLADVRRYDSDADEEKVQAIVKHLGIALRSRDASLVSASDQSELDRVNEKWCQKKLGMGESDGAEMVNKVASEMAGDKGNKQRVTFYYLCAKHSGNMDKI